MRACRRALCVSLHDVAPATLARCRATLRFLDDLGVGPVALLVVPDYHGLGRVDRDPDFCEFVRQRERRGDEIVLHGFRHLDRASPGRGLRDWLERRVYTDGEGEFSRVDVRDARSLILRGLAVLRSAGWQPTGFIAPAWLMSPGTRVALANLPIEYCSTRSSILLLREGRRIAAPTIVASTRSPLRRTISPAWNRALLTCRSRAQVLRMALHPDDLGHPAIRSMWRTMIGSLADRVMITEGALAATA
ncbi:MAG: polysaccharide deacetylase family protein [Steroidobacteraceae bacterium]